MDYDKNPQIMMKIHGLWQKSADYGENPQILVDFGINLVKLIFSFHSRVRIQGGNIFFNQNPWISA